MYFFVHKMLYPVALIFSLLEANGNLLFLNAANSVFSLKSADVNGTELIGSLCPVIKLY